MSYQNPVPSTKAPEPLPQLDYHLLHNLIALARPHLTTRNINCYNYLASARKHYFTSHSNLNAALQALLDVSTHGSLLDADSTTLTTTYHAMAPDDEAGKDVLRAELARLELAKRENNEELRWCLLEVERRRKARDHATVWLSALKWRFVTDEMPGLVVLAKRVCEQGTLEGGG